MAENVKQISLVVEEETRKGREGDYKVKVVKNQDKSWTVGKKYQDKVEVGKTYTFELQKSEYKDQIYYWANLIESQQQPTQSDAAQSQQIITNTQVVEYFKNLDATAKKNMIQYLVGLM